MSLEPRKDSIRLLKLRCAIALGAVSGAALMLGSSLAAPASAKDVTPQTTELRTSKPSGSAQGEKNSKEQLVSHYTAIIDHWSKHLARDPHSAIAVRTIARARLGLARATGDESQYRLAEELLRRKHLLHGPTSTATKLLLGRTLMARHGFNEALEIADSVLAQKSGFDARELRADALYALGRYEESFEEVRKLHAAKENYSSLARLADLHELHGEREEALTLFKQAKQSYQGDEPEPAAWIELRIGIFHLRAMELAEAEQQFQRALQIAPNYYLALEHLAEVYEIRGEVEKAKPLLEQALQVKNDPLLQLRYADILSAEGKEVKAEGIRQQAVSSLKQAALDGSDAHLREYAEYLLEEDRGSEALPLLKKDHSIRPGDLRANFLLARAYHAAKQPELAEMYLKQALRLGSKHAEYLEFAAELSSD